MVSVTCRQLRLQKNECLVASIPGVNANASVTDLVSVGSGGNNVTVNFTTTGSYQSLMPAVTKMLTLLKHYPGAESPWCKFAL